MTKAKNPQAYTSTQDVYVEGQYFKAGQVFVTDDAPADHWEKHTPAEAHIIQASTEKVGTDAPIEGLGTEALKAVAVTKGVNPEGMSKEDLKTGIKSAKENRL